MSSQRKTTDLILKTFFLWHNPLKGLCHEIFCFWFFTWISFPSLTPAANLPPVTLTPVANLPSVSTTQGELVAKFAAGVVDTGGNLPPVSLTPVATGVVETWKYLREFSKKFEMILMLSSGAWGKVIHEKNLNKKSRDTVPLNTQETREHGFTGREGTMGAT